MAWESKLPSSFLNYKLISIGWENDDFGAPLISDKKLTFQKGINMYHLVVNIIQRHSF